MNNLPIFILGLTLMECASSAPHSPVAKVIKSSDDFSFEHVHAPVI